MLKVLFLFLQRYTVVPMRTTIILYYDEKEGRSNKNVCEVWFPAAIL